VISDAAPALRLLGGRVPRSSVAGLHHPGSLQTRSAPTAPASSRSAGVYPTGYGRLNQPLGFKSRLPPESCGRARASQAAQIGTRIPPMTTTMSPPMSP
jgi:hypothetical protein